MIPNCKGCELELAYAFIYTEEGLNFAGEGLGEKGHLILRMVNDKGKVIVE